MLEGERPRRPRGEHGSGYPADSPVWWCERNPGDDPPEEFPLDNWRHGPTTPPREHGN